MEQIEKINEPENWKKELWDWTKALTIAFLLALMITSFVKPTLVVGQSMYPTFDDKNYLLVNRTAYWQNEPQHRDVIVFRSNLPNEEILIKRVIAVEGDKIRIDGGLVYINDVLQNEPYIHGQMTTGTINDTVPKGKVFVMGDNRNNSMDSRFREVGYLAKESIMGKVFFSVLPLATIKP